MGGPDLRPHTLTADDVAQLAAAEESVAQDAIVVRPHQDNSGIIGMDEVLRSLPRATTERRGVKRREVNTSTPFAFEMRYAPDPDVEAASERVLSLQYVGGDERLSNLLQRQLPDKYPDSRTEIRPATYLDPDPGDHIAAATLGLRRYSLYPLKNVSLSSFETDPTGSILTEMVGAATAGDADADVAVQIMVRPAGTDWQDGVPRGYGLADEYGDGLTASEEKVTSPLSTELLRTLLQQDTFEQRPILPTPLGTALGYTHSFFRDEFTHSPSKADKHAAKMLGDLDGRGWEFHVRIVAVSPDAALARRRVASTAEMFDNFYEYRGRQTFLTIPQNGTDAVDVATQAAGRAWPDDREQRMVKPQIEVAGLVNIPEAEHVSTNKLRWTLSSPGEGIPPRTPRFDFDTHGVADASQAARQVAMLDEADVGDPYWYGFGSRYGVEAGVTPETLRTHQFVGGGTGCHAEGTRVLMHDGKQKRIEDVEVGDRLMGPDSDPRTVQHLARGEAPMFEIRPVKGEPFTVTYDHRLTLIRTSDDRVYEGKVTDVPVSEWLQWSDKRKRYYKLFRRGVKFEKDWDLPIPPHALGVLIGDGTFVNYTPKLTTTSEVLKREAEELAKQYGLELTKANRDGGERAPTYRFSGTMGVENPLMAHIRDLGLDVPCGEKHIPFKYRTASRGERLELLAGLLDSDGWTTDGGYGFISKSERLSEDVAYLARSLGLAAYVNAEEKRSQNGGGGTYYRVTISGDCSVIPVRVPEKEVPERKQIKSVLRTGFEVESVGVQDYYGVGVDGDNRYLMGDFTVTHNCGKTTWLKNFSSQVMQRGHGALIIDPKGKDADEFIREWPADRDPEEFVFVDLSDEFDKQVRFNFMEVPGDADPESREFASTVEALCDDLASMVALAGGQDNYWGARMDRVIRTFIRGMAKSGKTCTLLDLAALCTAEENRTKFTEWMDDERLEFIRRTAQRIEGFDDADLEPLAGRLDQWIQNDAIRDLISARESTVSIHDVVAEGKVVVVRNAPSSGSTEKRLFATALIRRVWVAAREVTDRPPFYVICDEFDSVVSEQSDIASILSEARAFDCSLTLACQNPSNQLPDRIQKAIENQCETFITFNPGGVDDARIIAAQHSPDVEKEDLTNLSKYKFYMRTHDADDELTHSYKVDSFPPIEDVREDVNGEAGRTDAELQALKRESIERYGATVESPAEQRQSSHFYGGEGDADGPDTAAAPTPDDSAQQALCKAAYDASLHAGGDGTDWVDADAVCERLERYTDQEWSTAGFGGLADQTEGVEYRDRADGEEIRCTDAGRERFLPAGSNQTEGGLSHRKLLRDSYDPLTRLGLEVELPEQGGGREPDGIARVRESFDPPADATPAEIAAAVADFEESYPFLYALTDGTDAHIEAECSTGSGKPAATIENLAKAVEAGRRCLFVCRPETAASVYETLAEPPMTHPNPGGFDRRFYNRKRLQVDSTRPLRPAGAARSVWVEDDGEIVLRDSEGREHARFDSPAAVFEDADAYPARADAVEDEAIGKGEAWRPIAKPYIPERELPDGRDDYRDDWTILVVDRAEEDDGEGTTLRRFEDGEPVGDAGLPSDESDGDAAAADDGEPEPEADADDDDFWAELSGGD